MFYSKLLLSKKGDLNTIWTAAHGVRNLRREQIQQTDICASVDKFKDDEGLVISHRILAFLLLGVAKIHSKKAEYLYKDSQNVVAKLHKFIAGESKGEGSGASRDKITTLSKELELTGVSGTCNTSKIILPERFELDAFDLGIQDDLDSTDGNTRLGKDLMLADGLFEEGSASGLPNMANMLAGGYLSQENMLAAGAAHMTPPRDIPSLYEPSSFLEDRLEPMLLDEAEEEQMNLLPNDVNLRLLGRPNDDVESDSEMNWETPAETGYSSDHSLDSMPIECERAQAGDEDTIDAQQFINLTVDITPETKLAGGEVANRGIVTNLTPAPREHRNMLKRKGILLDETMKIPAIMYKKWTDNCTNLMRKRRRVSRTYVCKADRLGHLTNGIPIDLPVEQEKASVNVRSAKTHAGDHMPSIISPSHAQSLTSPGTPVAHSVSDVVGEPDYPSTSVESSALAPPSGGTELGNILGNEISLYEEQSPESDDAISARTRMTEEYLHENFLLKKGQEEDEALKLSQILEGKTKKESASLFYDILVLKTQDHIDVEQDEAYGDILLHETSTLEHLQLEHEPES